MADAALASKVKEMLIETLHLRMDPSEIVDSEPLFGEGLGLDSVDAIELVTAIEKRFGTVIESEEAAREAFQSVDALVDYLAARGVAA